MAAIGGWRCARMRMLAVWLTSMMAFSPVLSAQPEIAGTFNSRWSHISGTWDQETFVDVAAGLNHGLALLSDGSIAAWGDDAFGQCRVPAPPPGLGYLEVAAGATHSLALRSDGVVVAWGDPGVGVDSLPTCAGLQVSAHGSNMLALCGHSISADCQWSGGSGLNAATDGYVITSPAVLGGIFAASVTGCAPGNQGAILFGYAAPATIAHPLGEILVDITHPGGQLLGMPVALGNPAVFHLVVPSNPSLAGFIFHTQAASFGPPHCLHCAWACTIGVR